MTPATMAEQRAADAPPRISHLSHAWKASAQPLFVKRPVVEGESIWARQTRMRELRRASASGSGSSHGSVSTSQNSTTSAPEGTGPVQGGNWMDSSRKPMNLMQAYARTGNTADGRPRSADSVTGELTGTLTRASRFGHGGGNWMNSQRTSRVGIQDAYARAGREEKRPRSVESMKAELGPPINYGHGLGYFMDPATRRRIDDEDDEIFARLQAEKAGMELREEAPESTVEVPAVDAPLHTGHGFGFWKADRNRTGMDLAQAFAMALEEDKVAASIPRTAEWAQQHSVSPSRIPVMMSAEDTIANTSPPKLIKEMFARAEREESARLTPAPEPLPHLDYESESSGYHRQGSPSPAARNRNQPVSGIKTLVIEPQNTTESEKPMSRYERDLARKARMLANPTPLFVKKPRVFGFGKKVAETTRELERKASNSSIGGDVQNPSIESFENEPEPPYNIPASWKARRQYPKFAQRVLSPDVSQEIKNEVESINTEYEQQADIPLQSIELGSEPTPPSSRPASAQPDNEFLDEKSYLQPWDADADFTGQSELATSPMLKIRHTRLDEVRDREIRTLTARAVATNRLEEIRERNSEERSFTPEPPSMANQKEFTPNSTGLQKVDEQIEPVDPDVSILSDGGMRIRGTPVTVYPAEAYRSKFGERGTEERPGHKREDSFETLKKLARVLSQSPTGSPTEEKEEAEITGNKYEDRKESEQPVAKESEVFQPRRSADVERILEKSRERQRERSESAASDTPKKPSPVMRRTYATELEKPSEEQVAAKRPEDTSHKGKGLEVDVESKRRSRASSPPKSDVDPEERIAAEKELFELRDDKSERNSIRAPSRSPSPSEEGNYDETPRPNKPDPLSLPTPKVTGAYIETPAPSSRKLKTQRSISGDYEVEDPSANNKRAPCGCRAASAERQSKSESRSGSRATQSTIQHSSRSASSQAERPRLVNTAKRATAAEDLRRIRLEENIEDSTLDSLDNLLENEVADPDAMDQTAIVDLEYDDRGLPITAGEKERRLELLILERMARRLKNTSSSIRDARQGIERLEQEVSTSPILRAVASDGDKSGHYVEMNIKVKLPRLYTKKNAQPGTQGGWFSNRNWKFTWFGLIASIFVGWFLAESLTCDIYCKPEFSTTNHWSPTDPVFPWAIPTKLDQWSGEIVSGAYKGIENMVLDWKDPERYTRPVRPLSWAGYDGPVGIVRDSMSESFYDDDEVDD